MSHRLAVVSFVGIFVAIVLAAAAVQKALGEDNPFVYVPVGAVGGLTIGLACNRLLTRRRYRNDPAAGTDSSKTDPSTPRLARLRGRRRTSAGIANRSAGPPCAPQRTNTW